MKKNKLNLLFIPFALFSTITKAIDKQSPTLKSNVITLKDTDADGLPDDCELAYTNPASTTGLNPFDDLENSGNGDGLNKLQEYQMGTNPLNTDSDGDGVSDLLGSKLKTSTKVSNIRKKAPFADADKDGLADAVETNTGVFVDMNDTGTDPNNPDTDNDKAGDWYEVAASMTNPNDPNSKPNVPYPLPKPDGTTGSSSKPVKVYILSGQSNMVGFGKVAGTDLGTLEVITKDENKFPNLIDANGGWATNGDVNYRGVVTDIGKSPLTPLMAGDKFGPELGFGAVMGYYHDEPVLIIKSSQGNRSLRWDVLPPGSKQTEYNNDGFTYAGYGDSPNRWTKGTTPVPIGWYAGKQYDDFFLDEADFGTSLTWKSGTSFDKDLFVKHNNVTYTCQQAHTASAASEPGVGNEWKIHSIENVTDILDNFSTEYPQWASQDFEIAGLVWWQGHKDQNGEASSFYEENLVNLIKSLRTYYSNRYPGKIKPTAPFVLGTIAFNGWKLSGAGLDVAKAQLAVSGETGNYPDFSGNVKTVETRDYWRDFGPNTRQGYHYNWNAETYMLAGDALARAMIELNDPTTTILEQQNSNSILIYTDDSSNKLHVKGLSQNENNISIFNLLGQEVESYNGLSISETENGITLPNISGMYIIQVVEPGYGRQTTKKIFLK